MFRRVGDDLKAEAEAGSFAKNCAWLARALRVINCHQLDALGTEQSGAIQYAAVEHHLAKAQIIMRRRNQPAATRIKLRRTGITASARMIGDDAFARRLAYRKRRCAPLVIDREAFELAGGHIKPGVIHTQRFENALAEKFIQRHA